MNRVRAAYREELKEKSFTQDDAWKLLKKHSKWDVPEHVTPVDLIRPDDLIGDDPRPRPPANHAPKKAKSKTTEVGQSAYEVAKEKDRRIVILEEMKFLVISTKDLSEDDAYYINTQKEAIKQKYGLHRN
ncbi:hypothetical protein Tco_1338149 [Tanacetum coccineum]